jgi:hypothetical protein
MTLFSARRSSLIAVALVAAVATFLGYLALRGGEPGTAPAPSPGATVTPSPTPIPLAQPEPFAVKLRGIGVREMDNRWLFRGKMGNTRRGAAKPARRAVAELRRYLNGALVTPGTRFTARPMRRLLTKPAEQLLRPRDRRALGVGVADYAGGRSRVVKARAVVLYDGRKAHAVTVTYRARLDVLLEGERRRRPLHQRGVMVFVPTAAGWRADMVEVRLRLPPSRKGAPPQPGASPSGASPPAASPSQEATS